MHWIQGEKPVEYHVVRWDNSAFHNHDRRPERKMLGGVSFDGGGGKGADIKQTGVQTAQPSFSHTIEEGWFGNGMAEMSANQGKTNLCKPRDSRDTLEIRTAPELTNVKVQAEEAEMKAALEAASAGQPIPIQPIPIQEEKRNRAILRTLRKAGKGIQTFLREMEQRAGQRKRRKAPKKNNEGTRAAAKDEPEQIQADKSYLLDSYNKNGERSTLGR